MLLRTKARKIELHFHRALHVDTLQADLFTGSGSGFMKTSLLSALLLRVAIDFALIACFWGQSVLLIRVCIQGQVLPFVKSHA